VELTDREWEVLELLKEGLSTDEIAERLFVTPVTVRSHVSGILKKLRVPDRAAAVELLDRSTER
jgi:DNA-binding NarL/FixJ family response regulator